MSRVLEHKSILEKYAKVYFSLLIASKSILWHLSPSRFTILSTWPNPLMGQNLAVNEYKRFPCTKDVCNANCDLAIR